MDKLLIKWEKRLLPIDIDTHELIHIKHVGQANKSDYASGQGGRRGLSINESGSRVQDSLHWCHTSKFLTAHQYESRRVYAVPIYCNEKERKEKIHRAEVEVSRL